MILRIFLCKKICNISESEITVLSKKKVNRFAKEDISDLSREYSLNKLFLTSKGIFLT